MILRRGNSTKQNTNTLTLRIVIFRGAEKTGKFYSARMWLLHTSGGFSMFYMSQMSIKNYGAEGGGIKHTDERKLPSRKNNSSNKLLRGLSPRANYTDRVATAGRRS